jgi:hypothetical protein
MLDTQDIGFEFKAKKAMWTNQSKTDRISRKYPSPSNLVGIIQSIFDHPKLYPVVTRIDMLSDPYHEGYVINGRKTLKADSDRTQLFIQPVCDVHYRVFFKWLHLSIPSGQDFRKTQEQTWSKLEVLISDSTLPKFERLTSYCAGGKFGSEIEFHPLSETCAIEFSKSETTSFYRSKDGKFYHQEQVFSNGTWQIEDKSLNSLVEIIKEDRSC